MPRFHHVNLGVPPDVVESETDFLVSILDYRPLEIPPELQMAVAQSHTNRRRKKAGTTE